MFTVANIELDGTYHDNSEKKFKLTDIYFQTTISTSYSGRSKM